MSTTHHISFEELASNLTDVLNLVREEHKAVMVEYANGEQVVIKPVPVKKKKARQKIRVNYAAIEASAGSWSELV